MRLAIHLATEAASPHPLDMAASCFAWARAIRVGGYRRVPGDGFESREPSAPPICTDMFALTFPSGKQAAMNLFSDKKVSIDGNVPTYQWCHGRGGAYWVLWHHTGRQPGEKIRPRWSRFVPSKEDPTVFLDADSREGSRCGLRRAHA